MDLPPDGSATEAETFDEDKLSLLIEPAPAMVSFHFGYPEPSIVGRLQDAGLVVAATATTVNEAMALDRAGVDVVVAQGWEASGQRGSLTADYENVGTGTLALVPQICDAVGCVVAATGGMADGRGVVACHALGAHAA